MGHEGWEDRIDELLAAFDQWASGSRIEAAATARARERWLRQQSSEEATLAGSLIEIGEAGTPVILATPSATLHGIVAAVGNDACLLAEHSGPCVVPLNRLTTVVPAPDAGRPTPQGRRGASLSLSFLDILTTLAADRSPISLMLTGGTRVSGDLFAVGADHLQLRSSDVSQRLRLVALRSVELCFLR